MNAERPMTERDIEQLARLSLDNSIVSFDAGTLSRLNQARHAAIESNAKISFRRGWIPAAAGAALALAIFLPVNVQQVARPTEPSLVMPPLAEEVSLAALENRELLEDFDMMLWLVEVENHAS